MVVDEEANKNELTPLLWSERTSLLKKCLTEPTLLEMSGKEHTSIEVAEWRPQMWMEVHWHFKKTA